MISFVFIFFLTLFCGNKVSSSLSGPIDLSRDFNKNTLYWKGVQPFKFTKQVVERSPRGYFYAANEFCAGEHGGTHLDAPYHFNEDGVKAGDIPLKSLIVPGKTEDF